LTGLDETFWEIALLDAGATTGEEECNDSAENERFAPDSVADKDLSVKAEARFWNNETGGFILVRQ
jgi:hypothetical protein